MKTKLIFLAFLIPALSFGQGAPNGVDSEGNSFATKGYVDGATNSSALETKPYLKVALSANQTNATAGVYYRFSLGREYFDTHSVWDSASFSGEFGRTGRWIFTGATLAANIDDGSIAVNTFNVINPTGNQTNVIYWSLARGSGANHTVQPPFTVMYYCTNTTEKSYFAGMDNNTGRDTFFYAPLANQPYFFEGTWLGY